MRGRDIDDRGAQDPDLPRRRPVYAQAIRPGGTGEAMIERTTTAGPRLGTPAPMIWSGVGAPAGPGGRGYASMRLGRDG